MAKISAVTMRDVAHQCGVSAITVSRALRNSPNVSASTKKHITETATKLNYRVNPLTAASMTAIRSRKSRNSTQATIAYVSSIPRAWNWTPSKMLEAGIIEQCAHLGFNCNRFNLSDDQLAFKDIDRILWARGVSGLIFGLMLDLHCRVEMDLSRYAVAMCSNTIDYPTNLDLVHTDHFGNMSVLLNWLYQRGYRRIGLLQSASKDFRCRRAWISRYYSFHDGEAPGASRLPIFQTPEDSSYDVKEFLEWYHANKPDVIITTCEEIYKTGFFARAGLKCPEDVALAMITGSGGPPAIAKIDEDFAHIGRAAVDLVSSKLFANRYGLSDPALTVRIPGRIMEGQSAPARVVVRG